ncbi:Hypothetical protein FKW44_001634, partial [Caligus rogercresseyi]
MEAEGKYNSIKKFGATVITLSKWWRILLSTSNCPFQGFNQTKILWCKRQCQRCFGFGHMKHYCTEKRIKTFEYERALKMAIQERFPPQIHNVEDNTAQE